MPKIQFFPVPPALIAAMELIEQAKREIARATGLPSLPAGAAQPEASSAAT